jgi:hypothetical protein
MNTVTLLFPVLDVIIYADDLVIFFSVHEYAVDEFDDDNPLTNDAHGVSVKSKL